MKKKDDNDKPIVVKGLHKSFGEQTVLNGIDLTVEPGENLAVLGRSGTGKSVLLKLIIGLQQADSGSICIHGQAALYDSLTVEENVAFPLDRHLKISGADRKEKVRELLSSVGMDHDLDKLPSEISGGMQKRVGLARALALEPDILLFDEPTAGLDPITAAEIGKLIVDLKKRRKITSVVVTHDIRGAKTFSDRLTLMDKGSVVAEGTFEDLQKSRDKFVVQFLKNGA
jgi:phospholipid/cholesterol/gamma-HCH transport system ATP-binding protein